MDTGHEILVAMECLNMMARDTVMTLVARVVNDDKVSRTRDQAEGDNEPVRILSSGLIMINTRVSAVDKTGFCQIGK